MVYHHQTLDRTFAALADPTRRAIIARLATGERTISELASRFAMTLPAVSKHVRILERAGLARVRREGRVRRTTLVGAPMRDATAWMAQYRRFWEFQFDQLAAYLAGRPAARGEQSLTSTASTGEENPWPRRQKQPTASTRRSRSGASSPPHASASSTRGPKRKSSTSGARRRR